MGRQDIRVGVHDRARLVMSWLPGSRERQEEAKAQYPVKDTPPVTSNFFPLDPTS